MTQYPFSAERSRPSIYELKPVISTFAGKGTKVSKPTNYLYSDDEITAHILGIKDTAMRNKKNRRIVGSLAKPCVEKIAS